MTRGWKISCFYNEPFHVESYFAPGSHDFFKILISIVITALWEERAGLVYVLRVFACSSCMRCVLFFSLPLDVGGWDWDFDTALTYLIF